ncbi:IclR family transcriptional regulator [Pollutimonas sp. H1-120]|uniref:IclR family transcriptional regulator n=1 Tax=Pollutimonas sp. H1-120 TaxID=3148824 RepID=UPI003B51BA90
MTQSISRAIELLRLVGSSAQGKRLIDLQRESGLTKPTVHRILDTLRQHGFVAQDDDKRYTLGQEISVLGWSAGHQAYDLRELCSDHMVEVAQRTGDTSFLSVRSGYDVICLDRQSGSYPVKAFTIDVGNRRPLGVGAGGVVLLASLDEAEQQTVYEAIKHSLSAYHASTLAAIRQAVDKARKARYALSNGFVLPEVRGLGVPIRDSQGRVVAALSLAAIKERITPERLPELLAVLQTHSSRIEQRIAAAGRKGNAPARRIIHS